MENANQHFFQPLLPGFQNYLKIPVQFFSEHIKGQHEGTTVNLSSDASEKTWTVRMVGQRLTQGWKEFVEAHDLRVGDIVVFRHEGNTMFHVTALGPSFCEIQYAKSRSHKEEDEETDENEISSESEKKVEDNVKTKSNQSSSDFSCFSQSVTASNLSRDAVIVPIGFARRNGLNKERLEIVLMNEEGNSWESELKCSESSRVRIVRGWTSFCTANKLEVGDSCTFKLLQNTEKPVFRLCSRTKLNRQKKIVSEDDHIDDKTKLNRFVLLTPTPNSFELGKQMEQIPFETVARTRKKARIQGWNQEKMAAEGESSRLTRSRANQGNLQSAQLRSVSDQVAKVKQIVVDTLTSIRHFRAELESIEHKLEDSLQEFNNLGSCSYQRGEDNVE